MLADFDRRVGEPDDQCPIRRQQVGGGQQLLPLHAAVAVGAPVVELHTGCYADAENQQRHNEELQRIQHAADYAYSAGLQVNAGHGLHFYNVENICRIPQIVELNIGHSIRV